VVLWDNTTALLPHPLGEPKTCELSDPQESIRLLLTQVSESFGCSEKSARKNARLAPRYVKVMAIGTPLGLVRPNQFV